MANLNAALVQHFLNIALTLGKPVVEPKGMLDAAERKVTKLAQAAKRPHGRCSR